jgi:hypothetical protein
MRIWTRHGRAALGAALAIGLGGALASASAAERDLWSGLAHLRAGAQAEAERDFTRYRNEERDPEMRRRVDRVLPLLRRPLTEEVRQYIALTLEEGARARPPAAESAGKPRYWSRIFPVFP